MVPFAGYSLPVQYDGLGVLREHVHTRSAGCASLFDVSHMGQIKWFGKDAVKFIEKVVVGDIASLKPGEAKLSLIVNEHGTIVDDTVITNAGDHIYMVVNGACKVNTLFLKFPPTNLTCAVIIVERYGSFQKIHGGVRVRRANGIPRGTATSCTTGRSSIVIVDEEIKCILYSKGKGAKDVLAKLAPSINVAKMNFMTGTVATVAGIANCRVTRCGYTGEDGFELSVDPKNALPLARYSAFHTVVNSKLLTI